jgi:hypothetical protein
MKKTVVFLLAMGLFLPMCAHVSAPETYDHTFLLKQENHTFILENTSEYDRSSKIKVPRDWLIPAKELEAERYSYVSSFSYNETVTSFSIGNGKKGLHISSYKDQEQGSARAGAGRDIFLIYDPESQTLAKGLAGMGVTKSRVRVDGCFSAVSNRYLIADVNHDRQMDIGIKKEELSCVSKTYDDIETIAGPYYRQYPIKWYPYDGKGWLYDNRYDGLIPSKFSELPLIGMSRTTVDSVMLYYKK